MKKYTFKGKRGISDLKEIYAFIGNSQGDESKTNNIEVFKSSKGWMSYIFDCEMTEEAIKIEFEKRIQENEEYIQKLKKEGRFGEEYDINIEIEENPIFDSFYESKSISYREIIFDITK